MNAQKLLKQNESWIEILSYLNDKLDRIPNPEWTNLEKASATVLNCAIQKCIDAVQAAKDGDVRILYDQGLWKRCDLTSVDATILYYWRFIEDADNGKKRNTSYLGLYGMGLPLCVKRMRIGALDLDPREGCYRCDLSKFLGHYCDEDTRFQEAQAKYEAGDTSDIQNVLIPLLGDLNKLIKVCPFPNMSIDMNLPNNKAFWHRPALFLD